jgi:hypothetical protein
LKHNPVDIDHWKQLFPSSAGLPDAECLSVASPCHIAQIEQLRERGFENLSREQAAQAVPIAADVFLWAKGEPESRETTRIGGLPFWPRGRKWPEISRARPATFVGQICFADSLDIVPSLPSYMLLIFGELDSPGSLPTKMDFYWINTNTTDLVTVSDIPDTGVQITPCYGAIHRTSDYGKWFFADYGLDTRLAVIEGAKIGGIAPWLRPPASTPGTFLCSIGSLSPALQQPFPWLDTPEPIKSPEDGLLTLGNGGILYLFTDNRGRIQWTVQSRDA